MPTISQKSDYTTSYQQSLKNPEHYWSQVAQDYLWRKPFERIQSGSFEELNVKWFEGAQLNITENCLDRHLAAKGDQWAVIWEPNDPQQPPIKLTYRQLHQRVCQMANVLKKHQVGKGDRVCLYMSMVPELLIGVLACARIGAIHSVVFGGFSAQALANRIQDCQAKMLITNDEGRRGNKTIPLKETSDQALAQCPSIKKVLLFKHTGGPVPFQKGRDFWLQEELKTVSSECPPEIMEAEDPLFILYTSGSTGKPKGLLHTTAGYMVWVGESFKNVFQVQEKDIYWCTADIGWITGHSYIAYGPLLQGSTSVLFEGIPTYPHAGRFWEMIDKYKVTHFYTAPTAIRSLMAQDLQFVLKQDLSSLKVLGSVGEPINEEAWEWFHQHVGKKTLPHCRYLVANRNGGNYDLSSGRNYRVYSRPCHLPSPGS